ncbi:MAG: hypothetical protein ABUK01_11945 [Leptospirales bacterium]
MKHLNKYFTIMLLALITTSIAPLSENSRNFNIDTYDPATGLYYRSVFSDDEFAYSLEKAKNYPMDNLFIFDPKTNRGSYLFGPGGTIHITDIYFEVAFHKDKNKMENYNHNHTFPEKNNINITERAPLNRLLVITISDPKEKKNPSYSLWMAEKSGKNLRKIMIFSNRTNWHIDVGNKMIRILDQKDGKVMVNSIDL